MDGGATPVHVMTIAELNERCSDSVDDQATEEASWARPSTVSVSTTPSAVGLRPRSVQIRLYS
jgi:guanyl-specific ribonuclease Sa